MKMQRLMDILLSSVALVVLCPLLFVTCIILRFTGEGEVFFYQSRIGFGAKGLKL